jgi:hypothetical protein
MSTNSLRIQATGILAIVIVAYVLFSCIMLPWYQDYTDVRRELSDLNLLSANLENNVLEVSKYQKKHSEFKEKLKDSYDFQESGATDPLDWLHNISENSGIKIDSFTDHRHSIVNALPAVDIDLKAHGDYQQVCTFLHLLERSIRPCFVSRFKIDTRFDHENILNVEARILVFPVSKQFQDTLQSPLTSSVVSPSHPPQTEDSSS